VGETFLADKSIAWRGRIHGRLIISEKRIGKLVIPKLARGRERLLWGFCEGGSGIYVK
jgi:hypothetical protein